jgi:hypothetical protein
MYVKVCNIERHKNLEYMVTKICTKCSKEHCEKTKRCTKCSTYYKAIYEKNKIKVLENKKKRYHENREEIRASEQARRHTRECKMKSIRQKAAVRNLEVTMTDEEIMNMTDLPCVYCGTETVDMVKRNGIDRLDSSIGYELANCVPCCGICNLSKGKVDSITFVERIKQISLHHGGSGTTTENWTDVGRQSFAWYRWQMSYNNKIFCLTKDEFETIRSQDCYYCGRATTETHQNGIDCIDSNSSIGYTISNCVSACRDCNFMKNTMSCNDFIEHTKTIALCDYMFPIIPRVLTTFSNCIKVK